MADAPATAAPAAPNPAPAAPPQAAAATPAAVRTPSVTPAAAPQAPAADSSPPPAAAGKEPAKLIDNLIGGDKPAEAAKPDDGAAKPTEPAKPDEPIKYELKLPDGISVDEAQMATVTGILGKAKVAPEIAQELADFHAGALKNAATAFRDAQIETWNTTIKAWQDEVKADKEFGGNNWVTKKAEIENGLQTFFGVTPTTPENAPERMAHRAFLATLDIGGTGSRLPMMRFIHKAVSRGSEGKPVQGNGPSAPRKSPAEVMYPAKQQAAE